MPTDDATSRPRMGTPTLPQDRDPATPPETPQSHKPESNDNVPPTTNDVPVDTKASNHLREVLQQQAKTHIGRIK